MNSIVFFSYKQRRFNLFREESEGYAKLITELNNESIEHTSVNKILEIIKSLIGKNRIFEIIFDNFFALIWSIDWIQNINRFFVDFQVVSI